MDNKMWLFLDYRKNPKSLDTWKFAVIILTFEQNKEIQTMA